VEHGDSVGNRGVIGPGDVQWMTAASGIIHEEFHSTEFAKKGGVFEMVQLWVNLPARHKMDPPKYQPILSGDIPLVELDSEGSKAKIIAGDYNGVTGAASTHTPINMWDILLKKDQPVTLPLPDGHNSILLLRSGSVEYQDESGASTRLNAPQVALLSVEGNGGVVQVASCMLTLARSSCVHISNCIYQSLPNHFFITHFSTGAFWGCGIAGAVGSAY
jgi:quercetin 2,3-dioxygenase